MKQNRGMTIIEVLAALVAIAMLLGIMLPALARGQDNSLAVVSLSNLNQINAALENYANDHNGRQPSAIVDDFSTYGNSGPAAVAGYANAHGHAHPALILGTCDSGPLFAYFFPPQFTGNVNNYKVIVPVDFAPPYFGFFRLPNTRLMNNYLGGHFYQNVFYAPNDLLAYSITEPWHDYPCEFPVQASGSGTLLYSSYCFSPAAMFDPLVLRAPSAGGYVNPYTIPTGFRSPNVSQAKHAALKSRVMEHQWNQNAPANRCNSVFGSTGPYDNCTPYFFNHGAMSAPATLFFDGSTRLLPTGEVVHGDGLLLQQGGDGLWNRATPMNEGYYSEGAIDITTVSHHILTIDGIRGRDTLGPTSPPKP